MDGCSRHWLDANRDDLPVDNVDGTPPERALCTKRTN
jgi:hypothetical protein